MAEASSAAVPPGPAGTSAAATDVRTVLVVDAGTRAPITGARIETYDRDAACDETGSSIDVTVGEGGGSGRLDLDAPQS